MYIDIFRNLTKKVEETKGCFFKLIYCIFIQPFFGGIFTYILPDLIF